MRASILMVTILGLSSVCAAGEPKPWLGVHVGLNTKDNTAQLTEVVGRLAEIGINAIVAEINYGFEYQSHPELRSPNASNKEQIGTLVAECKAHHVRLIPQFQCLGHQSWSKHTFPLLTKYPQFDETPGLYANNEGIYCRSWCPLHPEVNPIVFSLMDELIDVFEADALHVGMDEVFLIGEDACPRCKGKDKAELLAKAVNDYHKHLVDEKKIDMLMWGDRLIDASKIKYGKWEASANGTAPAIDRVAKDIIICDWHYELRPAYESVPMFLEKGFRMWPASWRKPEAAKAFVDYSKTVDNPRMLGHLNTTWGAVKMKDLPAFEPLVYATSAFKER
ncbi:MAG: family 20 glycosylhydrolase [Sedimentisphaerales bacterium]|nr:family 20 glycosylhydrolase [Sedimentisphaerales bacterium]